MFLNSLNVNPDKRYHSLLSSLSELSAVFRIMEISPQKPHVGLEERIFGFQNRNKLTRNSHDSVATESNYEMYVRILSSLFECCNHETLTQSTPAKTLSPLSLRCGNTRGILRALHGSKGVLARCL